MGPTLSPSQYPDHKQPSQEATLQHEDELVDLVVDPIKYVTLPIENEKIWRKYQPSIDWFWTVYQVNIDKDRADMLEAFNQDQCLYLQKVVALMALAHKTIVKKELFLDLINLVDIKEASYYFGSQADSKKTHSMMYSMLLEELTGNVQKGALMEVELSNIPEVRQALVWYVERIIMDKESFAKRILTFATLQGILFTVPFILFSWIENGHPSKLSGLTKSNQLIWRDERLNLSLSCLLLSEIDDEVSSDEAIEIVSTAVKHAKDIFTKALPVTALGIDIDLMERFIEHSADVILSETNNKKIYHVETPFDWIVEPKIEVNEAAFSNIVTAATSTAANSAFELDDDF